MIYDCFTAFNELELLEIRLHELSPVVDRFVLVEATRTHSNLPKPLYFRDNWSRFAAVAVFAPPRKDIFWMSPAELSTTDEPPVPMV